MPINPLHLVEMMNAAPRCRAKSKRTRQPCRAPALRGKGVCRMHGGKGGAPCGERNGRYQHGKLTKAWRITVRHYLELLRMTDATLRCE